MTIIKQAYDAALTTIPMTLASLASGSAWQSDKIDNRTTQFDDVQILLGFKIGAGASTGTQAINVYLASSLDGTNWDYPATGTSGAITLTNLSAVRLGAVVKNPGNVYTAQMIGSLALILGKVPPFWALVVENQTGLAFTAVEGDHLHSYKGIVPTLV